MDQAELLRHVVEALEALGIDYMVGGSQASIYYGEPRFTQDIDVVVDMTIEQVRPLLAWFPASEFYLSEEAARDAIAGHGQFNIIHPESGLKIDVILKKSTPYDRLEFERRQRLPLVPGKDAYFARPEDVILYKLLYYREGRSDRHLRDIAGILAVSRATLDTPYIEEWARQLGVDDTWAAILRRTTEA